MNQHDPEATPVAGNDSYYQAWCESHGISGWFGPKRPNSDTGQADAQADADAHNGQNPGHYATVVFQSSM
jgi:hypothetical protein